MGKVKYEILKEGKWELYIREKSLKREQGRTALVTIGYVCFRWVTLHYVTLRQVRLSYVTKGQVTGTKSIQKFPCKVNPYQKRLSKDESSLLDPPYVQNWPQIIGPFSNRQFLDLYQVIHFIQLAVVFMYCDAFCHLFKIGMYMLTK